MGIIIKARKYLNRKSLLNLYHAFVFPYLTYCIEIWGNASDIHLDALLKVKKNYKNMYKNFSFIGVQIWNDVQKHINVSMSFSSFKKSTRTYYLYIVIFNYYIR